MSPLGSTQLSLNIYIYMIYMIYVDRYICIYVCVKKPVQLSLIRICLSLNCLSVLNVTVTIESYNFKKLIGLKIFFSILLTSFRSFFNLVTCSFEMLLSPYASSPGLELVLPQLGERISDL